MHRLHYLQMCVCTWFVEPFAQVHKPQMATWKPWTWWFLHQGAMATGGLHLMSRSCPWLMPWKPACPWNKVSRATRCARVGPSSRILGKSPRRACSRTFCIMHTLLGFNHLGIFKKQQLKDSLMVLDRKLKKKQNCPW